ncbi:hypothetical protein UNSWCS_1098 [Campylobacter concisus UNSWCS]|uniref:Uncharacterized protein n=1 Tax=Campylobacter concisus UNSWCS TaxID=1242968 RepID=U2GN57_9BACT|nr:hypothetical protein UNSWCS_1098 [Campylobacter concisus UNSWCS]
MPPFVSFLILSDIPWSLFSTPILSEISSTASSFSVFMVWLVALMLPKASFKICIESTAFFSLSSSNSSTVSIASATFCWIVVSTPSLISRSKTCDIKNTKQAIQMARTKAMIAETLTKMLRKFIYILLGLDFKGLLYKFFLVKHIEFRGKITNFKFLFALYL